LFKSRQSTLINVQNKIIRKEFDDVVDDDDITTPRSTLKVACLQKDDDTATMCLIRLIFFYVVLRKARDLHPAIYGIPTTAFQSKRKFKPQITLKFSEDLADVDPGYDPVEGEISFRLMNQESTTLTISEAKAYANKVKTAFCAAGGFLWKKGKVMVSYSDWDKGYQLQLLCRDKAEGKRVIEQVLDIQGHSPDWKHMNVNENQEPLARYPTIPPNKRILDKTRRQPRERPIATVRFQWAELSIHGEPSARILADRTGRWDKALVK